MSHAMRLLAACSMASWVTGLSPGGAQACECAMPDFETAIVVAEVAGTHQGIVEGSWNFPLAHRWRVERSRDQLQSATVQVRARTDDGASCGLSFNPGERWLILAYPGNAGLETNRCMGNQELEGVDGALEARIKSILRSVPPSEPAAAGPGPVVIGAVALSLVSLAWLGAGEWRYRRRVRGSVLRPTRRPV